MQAVTDAAADALAGELFDLFLHRQGAVECVKPGSCTAVAISLLIRNSGPEYPATYLYNDHRGLD